MDFEDTAVLVITWAHSVGCAKDLVSLIRDGTVVTPRFGVRSANQVCGSDLVGRTYFVAVARRDVPTQFTLVLEGASDGSHPEQRLEVDLKRNLASSAPPDEIRGLPRPDGA